MSNPSSQTEFAESAPCVVCRLPLPIRPKPAEEVGQQWACVGCGTEHHGVFLKNAPSEVLANVRPADATDSGESSSISTPQARESQGAATKPLPHRGPMRCEVETPASREVDEALSSAANLLTHSEGPSFLSSTKSHAAEPYDPKTVERLNRQCHESLQQIESLIESLEQGKSLDLEATEAITQEALVSAAKDLDLFVRLGINSGPGKYPSSHSLHVAMLAASVGANMGWDTKTLVELGVGCLLHDSGMIRVPEDCYDTDRVLDDGEFTEILRHPLHTFDLLADEHSQVPLASRMVAFQMHERCDGSGYPRNRLSEQIHEAAKVAAVADVYMALVSARPHRPALMPYFAVEHLLYGVKNGQFDSTVVRAFLKTVSLFPIGSYLKLADHRVARVIRANPECFGRPVIEVWLPDKLDQTPEVVDLSQNSLIAIQNPVPSLKQAE